MTGIQKGVNMGKGILSIIFGVRIELRIDLKINWCEDINWCVDNVLIFQNGYYSIWIFYDRISNHFAIK